ncbi:hypothetical protein Q3C01_08650 [Bradyrhizobium sp. UFLA05-109]
MASPIGSGQMCVALEPNRRIYARSILVRLDARLQIQFLVATNRCFQSTNISGNQMKIPAYHTDSQEYSPAHRNVHLDDHDNCPAGKQIKQWHRKPEDTGKPRCDDCKKLG